VRTTTSAGRINDPAHIRREARPVKHYYGPRASYGSYWKQAVRYVARGLVGIGAWLEDWSWRR
jgi:hypothetical protein